MPKNHAPFACKHTAMNQEPSFDQIPIRMLQLGVDRQWLADQCDYTRGTLAAILAPNGSPKFKTNKALRRMWEALDREQERQESKKVRPIFERQQLVLRPTDEEYARWSEAQRLGGQPTLAKWALDSLNRITEGMRTSVYPEAFSLSEWERVHSQSPDKGKSA